MSDTPTAQPPEAPDDFAPHAATILARAKPGDTMALVIIGADGGMVASVLTERPRDLLEAARTLLEQAAERLAEDARNFDDDMEAMLVAEDALDALQPDRHDEDEETSA